MENEKLKNDRNQIHRDEQEYSRENGSGNILTTKTAVIFAIVAAVIILTFILLK